MHKLNDPNIHRINELWGIHWSPGSPAGARCLACLIDTRFVFTGSMERRLALSFGHNPFTAEMNTGFVRPPIHPGAYVFGLHLVAIVDDQLTLYDQWMEGFASGDDGDVERALRHGNQLLESISDEEFQFYVLDTFNGETTVQRGLELEPCVVHMEAF